MTIRTISRSTIGGAAIAAALALAANPVAGQVEADCAGGWARSCASVQMAVSGDRLLFYVPNAVAPAEGRLMSEARARRAAADGQRVRVYRSASGAVCDPATGRGCIDVTSRWLGPDPDEAEDPEGEEDEDGCVDGERRIEEVSGDSVVVTEKDRDAECAAFLPNPAHVGIVTFAVTLPVTTPLWLDPENDPITVRSASEDGEDGDESDEGDDGQDGDGDEEGTTGGNTGGTQGGDDGQSAGDEGQGGDGEGEGDGESGDDGGEDEGDGGEDEGDGGEDEGDSSGDDGDAGEGDGTSGTSGSTGGTGDGEGGNGESDGGEGGNGEGDGSDHGNGEGDGNGSDGEAEEPWPGGGTSDDQPPMTEVPEPVTTTLVGLGLLGYAGSRLRRRREDDADPDGIG